MSDIQVSVVNMCDYDYLLLGCGYIDRLQEKTKEIISATEYNTYIFPPSDTSKSHDLVYFIYFSEQRVARIQMCNDKVFHSALEAQRQGGFTMKDSVCIRRSDFSHELVRKIKSYHHCPYFDERALPVKIVSFTTFTGKKVLYMEYDTECGIYYQ